MTGREEIGQYKSLKKSGWLFIMHPGFPAEFFSSGKEVFSFYSVSHFQPWPY